MDALVLVLVLVLASRAEQPFDEVPVATVVVGTDGILLGEGCNRNIAMLALGGKLKMKGRLSARLGDVLSERCIASAVLKRYEDQRRPEADRLLLAWTLHAPCSACRPRWLGSSTTPPVRWLSLRDAGPLRSVA